MATEGALAVLTESSGIVLLPKIQPDLEALAVESVRTRFRSLSALSVTIAWEMTVGAEALVAMRYQ